MAGNRERCSSQLAEMQYPVRFGGQGSNGKSIRSSTFMPGDGTCNRRLNSRGLHSFHRSGTRYASSRGSTRGESSTFSSSSSSRPSSSSLNPKNVSQDLSCLTGSSDESGSDSDLDVVEQETISRVPLVMGTIGQNSSESSSSRGFDSFTNYAMEGHVAPFSRETKIQGTSMLSWGEHHGLSASESRMARASSSSAFTFDQDGLHGVTTLEVSDNPLLTGSASDRQCIDDFEGTSHADKRERLLSKERAYISDVKMNNSGSRQSLQASGITVGLSRHAGQPSGGVNGSECRRKSGTQGVLSRRSRAFASHGTGLRESSGNPGGSAQGAGSSKRNLSNLGCSSAADVLPSVASCSTVGASDRVHHRKTVGLQGLSNGGEALRGLRTGKNRAANGSGGCMGLTISDDTLSGHSTELNFSRLDLQSARPVRRSSPVLKADPRCPRRPLSSQLDPMPPSGSHVLATGQSSASIRRHRGDSPTVSRGRNSLGFLTRSNEHFLDSAAVSREELHNSRSAGNSSRISSRSSTYGSQLAGPVGMESGNTNRGRVDSRPSSSSTMFVREAQSIRSSLPGPPPTRPPPLPPFGSALTQSSSFSTGLSDLPHSLRTAGLASSDEHESFNSSTGQPAPHSFQLRSVGENRPHLTVEGLSEILLALEHVERDEDLSYEQILMLEATILLGGMGLHDRHRDMRLDVDSMSYEELLALEERMGNVSTGLSEESIAKCVKRIRYTTPELTADYIPQDIEIKCSICQEEFEEAVELGVLRCGHGHHMDCIKQWLLQKNQCPICKAPALA